MRKLKILFLLLLVSALGYGQVEQFKGEPYFIQDYGGFTLMRHAKGPHTVREMIPVGSKTVLFEGPTRPDIADLIASGVVGNNGSCDGAGLSFDGFTQYVYVADNGALDIASASSAFMDCAYIKTGSDISTLQSVLGKQTLSTDQGKYGYYISGGTLYSRFRTADNNDQSIPDNITLATNTWYHVATYVDLTNKKAYFYIDGVLQNAGGKDFSSTSIGSSSKDYTIGSAPDGSYFFGGQIKDVRIYHRDVTSQLTAIMNGQGVGGEVAWWCLPTLTDQSTNSYDLTGVNLAGYDILAFEDYASTIDGATKVRTLGDELVTNGNMSSATGWTILGNWSIGSGVASNTSGNAGEGIRQTGVVESGVYYKWELEITAYTSGEVLVRIGDNYDPVPQAVGVYQGIALSDGTNVGVYASGASDFVGSVDNFSVKKITTATAEDTDGVLSSGRLIDMIPQGSELVTNGDFADWTGDDPDDWTVENEDANNYITESAGGGECRIVSDNSAVIRMTQNVLTEGKYYLITLDCIDATSGSVTVSFVNDRNIGTIDQVGTYTFVERSTPGGLSTGFRIARTAACDVTIDNVSVKELQVLGDDLVTNGDFAADTDWTKGDGWSISGGTASCDGSQASVSNLTQTSILDNSGGSLYLVKYTISNYSAGSVYLSVNNSIYSDGSAAKSANGTYTQLINPGYINLAFRANASFIGDIDNVSVHKLTKDFSISNSTNYSGTQYILPVDEFDFIIPVDYSAESIDGQVFNKSDLSE